MKLAIIGDTRHSRDADGRLGTLSPVVRQLRPWLRRFDEVIFCGTLHPGPPPPTHEPYEAEHVHLRELPIGGGEDVRSKVGLVRRCAEWWPVLRRTLRECDVVHFRCPCNVALVGLVAMRGLPIRRFAMYAGNWAGYPGESPFYRLQRRWLASASFGGPVAVYGPLAGQPGHLLDSFSPSFTRRDWMENSADVGRKLTTYAAGGRLQVLRAVSVGHLNSDKDQATILRALARLQEQGLRVELELLGDGPERPRLESLAVTLGLAAQVRFRGRVSLAEVRSAYLDAHVAILASRTEGFPKVLAEAMACGAVPLASRVGLNAAMLAEGERGLLFPFRDDEGLAGGLRDLAGDPRRLGRMATAGREYALRITLEQFEALQDRILTEWLRVPETPPSIPTPRREVLA